jgi:hypothetical protein
MRLAAPVNRWASIHRDRPAPACCVVNGFVGGSSSAQHDLCGELSRPVWSEIAALRFGQAGSRKLGCVSQGSPGRFRLVQLVARHGQHRPGRKLFWINAATDG